VPAPGGADSPGHRPEQPVAAPEPRARAGAEGHGQLLPEEQVLHQERVPVAEQHAQGAEQKPQPVQHGRSMPQQHLAVLADELLASYS